jgi:hypothetical protein
MGIRSMVQFAVKVAAFAAVAALLLQISCMVGLPAVTTVQIEWQGDAGCHESAPPTPNTPDSSHICCSGDHSPDALLSAFATPAPLVFHEGVDLASTLRSSAPSSTSTDCSASLSPPHGLLALRI